MAIEEVGVRAVIEGLNAFIRGTKQMEDGLKDIGKAGKASQKDIDLASKTLRNFGLAMTAASVAGGAFLLSATRLAARVETLGVVTETLGRNVGKSKDEIRDLEQAIKSQGITLRGSREAIARMIQANIDLEKSTELARLAQDAAVIGNLNSTDAFNTLVNVISTGNVRMARNIGLQVSFQKAYEKSAKTLGINADELTEVQKVQARTNAVLEAGTNIAGAYSAAMDTAGKRVLSLDRHLEETRRIIGESFLPAFGGMVDIVTDALKKFENLNTVQQRQVAATLGMVTAWTGLIGAGALLISVLLKVRTALLGVRAIAAIGLGPIGALAAIIAVATTALVAYAAKVKAAKEETKKLTQEAIKSDTAYEDYVNQIRDYSEETGVAIRETRKSSDMFGGQRREITKVSGELEIMTEKQFNARRQAEIADRVLITLAKQFRETADAAEEFGATQEELQASLKDLELTIRTDVGRQFTDYREKIVSLNDEIDILEGQTYLTTAQKEDLERLREELKKTEDAFDQTTKEIIFDLAKQRLAIDGFTQEEIDALQRLAGPEGLGLVDAAGAALIEKIDLIAQAMDAAGDQSAIFAGDMVALQGMMLDPTVTAEALAAAIRAIQSKTVTVTTVFRTVGAPSSERFPQSNAAAIAAANAAAARARAATAAAAAARAARAAALARRGLRRQVGGFVQAGQTALIGEGGPEAFVPRSSGTVLSNRFLNAIGTLVAALKSAPALAAPSVAATPVIGGARTSNFNMNINTRAAIEPIIADFRSMQSMAGAF